MLLLTAYLEICCKYYDGYWYILYLPPVLAPRFIFASRPVSLQAYTVIERVKSRFRKDRTKRDEHLLKMLQTVSNHESSGYPTLL